LIRIKIGDILTANNDVRGALREYDLALTIAEKLLEKPENSNWSDVIEEVKAKIKKISPGLRNERDIFSP
jgi:hypothetical protein